MITNALENDGTESLPVNEAGAMHPSMHPITPGKPGVQEIYSMKSSSGLLWVTSRFLNASSPHKLTGKCCGEFL